MWTYVAPWLVQTGEVPQLAVGGRIERLGVRALWWSVGPAGDEPDGIIPVDGPDPAGEQTPHYRLTGSVTWSQEPSSLVVDLGTLEVLAEPRAAHVVVLPGGGTGSAEPVASAGPLLEVGGRVSMVASFAAMVDFETDASTYPDLRRPWVVHAIRVEHRELVWLDGGATRAGGITRVDEIDEMLRWSDLTRKEFGSYLLDLSPLPA